MRHRFSVEVPSVSQGLDILIGHDSPVRCRIAVQHLHRVARDLWVQANGSQLNVISGKAVVGLVEESNGAVGGGMFSTQFLRSEWTTIIDPNAIRSWDEYRATPRVRRGKPLGARQKLAAWRVFERMIELMRARNLRTWDAVCHEARTCLEKHTNRPFRHVVVDEAQDFGPAELKFLRALCPNEGNDLFLCSDAGQRIYRGRCSWASLGIDIRGRSSRLKLNYRTTETIRRFADRLLPATIQGGGDEGETEKRDAVSLVQGPEPMVAGFTSQAEEVHGLAAWLIELVNEGFRPNDIAIFGRTDSIVTDMAGAAVTAAGLSAHKLIDDEPQSGEDVFIGTMHRAKGLEFRAVAVIGAGQANLPLRIAIDALEDPGDRVEQIEQERQLLYVACSRARERLLVSYTGEPSTLLS